MFSLYTDLSNKTVNTLVYTYVTTTQGKTNNK